MSSLYLLNMQGNQIATIGLNVFTTKAGLVSLHDIDLSFNKLTELEPWPLIRGQLVPHSLVNLESNGVASFTNRLNWSLRCGMKSESMTLNLKNSSFEHLTDLTNGWNITGNHNYFDHSIIHCILEAIAR